MDTWLQDINSLMSTPSQKVFLGYNLGRFYLVNYVNQIFYVLYILIIIWTYLRFQQFEISFIKLLVTKEENYLLFASKTAKNINVEFQQDASVWRFYPVWFIKNL